MVKEREDWGWNIANKIFGMKIVFKMKSIFL